LKGEKMKTIIKNIQRREEWQWLILWDKEG